MDLLRSSCWESILEKARPHIPTMDFDSSSSENEEIATIYQRPVGLSLTVPEDFDLFSMDDDDLEELWKPVAQTRWTEESVQSDDDDNVERTTFTQTQHVDAAVEGDAPERGLVESDASVRSPLDSTTADQQLTVLSFAKFDQWDLDDVLKNLDRLPLQQHVSVEPLKTHADGKKEEKSAVIMERLVAFCNRQSSKNVSEPMEIPNLIKHTNVWKKSSGSLEDELQLSQKECATVYIDLRGSDSSIEIPSKSPGASSKSKSPAKCSDHHETPKKVNLKVDSASWKGGREVSGKNMLLQKIRQMKGNGDRNPNECKDPSHSVSDSVLEKLKEKVPQAVESMCRHESHKLGGENQSSYVQFEYRTPETETPPTSQQRPIKKTKQQSDQQRPEVKQTNRHAQHIPEQLELHRPLKSFNQKQPAAERTDVLYDCEASHLQSISTLPTGIETKGRMLLIVDLSSPGVVGSRAHRKRKHLISAATKSHTYNTLVAWFLSLVGPEAPHDEDEAGAKVPFWVAGLQQQWTEDGLALLVLVVARHSYAPRKSNKDLHAPFYHHVCSFLTETSLSLIATWLPVVRNLLSQQAFASPIHLPSCSLNGFISTTSNKKVIDRTFGLSPGFYWQTMETAERVCRGIETAQELHTEVSVAVGCKAFLLHPVITHYTLQLVLDSGLDVCGLRLLYPPQDFLSDRAGAGPVSQRTGATCQPVLALAVRGLQAHSVLRDLTSCLDPLMPEGAEPLQPPLWFSPRLAGRVHGELCLWFAGRVRGGKSAQPHNRLLSRAVPSNERRGVLLCATTKADLLLVVSPAVPPCCYGQVLAVCERRGFILGGLQRLRLQSNGAAGLGLSEQQARVFCIPHAVTPCRGQLELLPPCLVLLLRKENAVHHTVSLPAALMRECKTQKLLGCIQSRFDGVQTAEPSSCFHTVPYSSNLYRVFVRRMRAVPDPSSVILSPQKSSSDVEQLAILTFCGRDTRQGLSLLHTVLTEEPEGFELLGLKWLPALTRLQARELSPYEVGQQLFQDSLDRLMPCPALVCALKHADAFASLRKLLPQDYPGDLSVLMSPTPEVAFRQASLFFFEHEMISDPQMLVTLCLFKPTIWNHTLAKTAHKLQLCGLTMVGLRVLTLDKRTATSLLPAHSDPSDLEAHVAYLCSGSSLALCLQGGNAVSRLLDVLDQDDYRSLAHSYNGVYGSGSYQKAIQDVKRFFPEGLCCTETSAMRREQILSVRSDPLVSVERERSCREAQRSASPSRAPGHNTGIHSALWQTTFLLIPLTAPARHRVPSSQLDVLERLLRAGCHLAAGRMSVLDNEQSKHIAEALKGPSGEKERMAGLYSAPCLIVALQGEAIVTRVDSILERIYEERSELQKVGQMIIYPKCQKEANQLMCYLFDDLS